eukprot:g29655.t1
MESSERKSERQPNAPPPSKKRKKGKAPVEEKASIQPKAATPLKAVAPPPAPSPLKPRLFKEEDLQCLVCFDLPPSHIFQCENGHLLCEDCHNKVLDSAKPQCPSCRQKLTRDHPTRNRFAENVLAKLLVPCPNKGCSAQVTFKEARTHAQTACTFRSAICKYQPIGCNWEGIHEAKRPHEKKCRTREQPVKVLLQNVQERNAQREKAQSQAKNAMQAHSEVSAFFSRRARDIAIRDVVIERDNISNEMCSKTFSLLGLLWEAVLKAPGESPNTADIFLRVVCSVKRKIHIGVLILPGPDLASVMTLLPSSHTCLFRRHCRKIRNSGDFRLPLQPEQAEQLHKLDSINLRIAMEDISRGRPSGAFTTLASAANDEQLSDSSDDTEELEEEEDIGEADEDDELSEVDDVGVFELTPREARAAGIF